VIEENRERKKRMSGGNVSGTRCTPHKERVRKRTEPWKGEKFWWQLGGECIPVGERISFAFKSSRSGSTRGGLRKRVRGGEILFPEKRRHVGPSVTDGLKKDEGA